MSWLYLAIAIALEVSGTTCMKLSAGFTKPLWGACMVVFYTISFTALTMALKTLDVLDATADPLPEPIAPSYDAFEAWWEANGETLAT